MTKQQQAWASTHDWFIRTRVLDGVHGVRVSDDLHEYGFQDFYDFQELRNWAGY
ncbi:hypothetical protein [Pseudomonas phage BUCT553]|uniref:Uncharacterized protein n=2 Tax=Colwellvirinae TaxID=2731646 RepID=A0A873W791_9CAUD|nr:hypothetical protein [Pseudomonas phage BUCT553]